MAKKVNFRRLWRKIHYWGSIVIAIPILIVILSGILLQVKKEVTWIQPKTQKGVSSTPEVSFATILQATKTANKNINTWDDIEAIDVRPDKGIVKVKGKNKWEVQIDFQTGEILQVAYRRSDLIESLHDGSFFHEHSKLWLFLPTAVILLILWLTGMYLFFLPILARRKKK